MAEHKGLVVVTGASSGIGKATAKAFVDLGYAVLLLARRVEIMEAFDWLSDLTMVRQLDVTDREAFQTVIKEAESKFGPTEILINNAGVMYLGQLEEQPIDQWETMVNVNILGVLYGMRVVINDMVARNSGTIVNISSVAGKKTFANHAVYCGTKFAVHAFTDEVRREVCGSGVRCIVIAPGVVETELLGHTTNEEVKAGYESWKSGTLKNTPLTSEDVADSIIFAATAPPHVHIREIVLTPTFQDA
eukprot:TRINITY_DN12177_c0_g1_i1.p1 TRINITY_DN12177_c0_g1~~TRINITY_DN12177_c0_g1_i1.p1  ORF type:complete len:247 (-),score=62.79 TRINITY_DN12177_c0_g1_i1:59-799(-)